MRRIIHVLSILTLAVILGVSHGSTSTAPWQSTRVTDANHYAVTGSSRYPFRAKSEYILKELDLRPGDVVVDIGAGDGWWSERMAKYVGDEGVIHAGEVEENKVSRMKDKYAAVPQIKPYLCPEDGTALPENSCDLAFFSLAYHHLRADGRVDYLRHLRSVVKPTGRVCVIEKYSEIAIKGKSHGVSLSQLVKQAEEAGWIPVRYEFIIGTRHYIAFFVQEDLF